MECPNPKYDRYDAKEQEQKAYRAPENQIPEYERDGELKIAEGKHNGRYYGSQYDPRYAKSKYPTVNMPEDSINGNAG